jgi:hypothetical protein
MNLYFPQYFLDFDLILKYALIRVPIMGLLIGMIHQCVIELCKSFLGYYET